MLVFLNTGSGFGSPTAVATGLGARRVVLADMNGDGKLDAVTSNSGTVNTISVLLGAGDGTFPTRRDFGAGTGPKALAIGGFDAGSTLDLVVASDIPVAILTFMLNRATVTGIESAPPSPRSNFLAQNFPNPFNPATVIEFTLSNPARVKLRVFDVHGRLVATLVDAARPAGRSRVQWAGMTDHGHSAASGVYLYKLEANGVTSSRRMVLAR